ncbi:50S ribosomal protein L30 [Holospora obtusa F1]|uniref:50S ribosomal protein L30 n=1 Tax=Holospora obtusa F1 TaxID=1399147 RepID=W6TGX8_HOLOB|nr:50S ribosomal protein L30 [Holospora obtusa]ETZ07190.1 50S ribosomal protein L30 [Holospora obtusa F1]
MKYFRCIQYRSSIRVPSTQKKILKALGMKKLGKSKVLLYCPSVLGMVKKVEHLVKVELC